MIEISDTEAAERFTDLLDAVEQRGETFLVVRGGTVVATIAPVRGTSADLRRIRAAHPPDDAWEAELRELRRFADSPTTDAPND